MAVHIGARVGGEKHHGTGQFRRLPPAADGGAVGHRIAKSRRGNQAGVDFGVEIARRYAIAGDVAIIKLWQEKFHMASSW